MKTLLIAIDNSPVAEHIIELTIEQALAQRAEVMVLCCVDPAYSFNNQLFEVEPGENPDDFVSARDEQDTAERVVRHALAILLRAGITAKGMIIAGEAAGTIVEQSRKLHVDMIIMGRRHLSPFNRLLKGSISAAVIEQANCPVLLDLRE